MMTAEDRREFAGDAQEIWNEETRCACESYTHVVERTIPITKLAYGIKRKCVA